MTKEEFDREFYYQLIMYFCRIMLQKGLMTEEEYEKVDKEMCEEVKPPTGNLFSSRYNDSLAGDGDSLSVGTDSDS